MLQKLEVVLELLLYGRLVDLIWFVPSSERQLRSLALRSSHINTLLNQENFVKRSVSHSLARSG